MQEMENTAKNVDIFQYLYWVKDYNNSQIKIKYII